MDHTDHNDNKRRIAEYFVVAGLPPNPKPYDFSQVCRDSEDIVVSTGTDFKLDFTKHPEPIVDIQIVNIQQHEVVPPGYTVIERSFSGAYKADLNGFTAYDEMYICYRRGRDKPPITDIGIFYPKGKLTLREDAYAIFHTVGGRPANINKSSSVPMFLSVRSAPLNAAVDTLAVTDICIILLNKGESCPPAYNRLDQCLNESILGHRIYLCYKKSTVKQHVLSYEPTLLFRYPQLGTMERTDDSADTENVASFCLPWGATIEAWNDDRRLPNASFFTFVLTNERSHRMFGAAVQFYEPYDDHLLNEDQRAALELPLVDVKSNSEGPIRRTYTCKAICLLSRWPFFEAFKRFLSFLYKLVFVKKEDFKDACVLKIPLERYIYHFMHCVPFPTLSMPNVLVQINDIPICFQVPEESFNMTGGEAFFQLIVTLKVDHIICLLLYMLTQQSILLTSLLPSRLTEIGEALRSMIFPLQWYAPYAPFMYLGMIPVVQAFTPFLFGVDTRFFDFFNLPEHIACLDLDTGTVRPPTRPGQPTLEPKLFPKKPLKILRTSLDALMVDLESLKVASRERSRHKFTESDEFKMARRKSILGLRVKECFLRFMAHLLKGYKLYRPHGEKDVFKTEDFLDTVERSSRPFYRLLLNTQMWNSFIYERLFPTTRTDALAFFDHCVDKVQRECDTVPLMHIDKIMESEHTKVIGPPILYEKEESLLEEHRGRGIFPTKLNVELLYSSAGGELLPSSIEGSSREWLDNLGHPLNISFRSDMLPESLSGSLNALDTFTPLTQRRSGARNHLRRTKWEIEEALRIGLSAKQSSNPRAWSLHLFVSCCELWFVTLPAHIRWLLSYNYCDTSSSDITQIKNGLTSEQEIWLHHLIRACVRMLYNLKEVLKMANKLGRHPPATITHGVSHVHHLPPSPTTETSKSGPTLISPQNAATGDAWARLPDEVPSRILVSLLAQYRLYGAASESGNSNSSVGSTTLLYTPSSSSTIGQWRLEDIEAMSQNLIDNILFEYTFESHKCHDVDSKSLSLSGDMVDGPGEAGEVEQNPSPVDENETETSPANESQPNEGKATSFHEPVASEADSSVSDVDKCMSQADQPHTQTDLDTGKSETHTDMSLPPVVHRIHRMPSRHLRRYCSMGPGEVMNLNFFQRRPSDTGMQPVLRQPSLGHEVADKTGFLPSAGLILSSLVPGCRFSRYYHPAPLTNPPNATVRHSQYSHQMSTSPNETERPKRSSRHHSLLIQEPMTKSTSTADEQDQSLNGQPTGVSDDSKSSEESQKNIRPNTLPSKRSFMVERSELHHSYFGKTRSSMSSENAAAGKPPVYPPLSRIDSSSSISSATAPTLSLLSRISTTAGGIFSSLLLDNTNNATAATINNGNSVNGDSETALGKPQSAGEKNGISGSDSGLNRVASPSSSAPQTGSSEDTFKRTGSLRFMSPTSVLKNVRTAIGTVKATNWLGKAMSPSGYTHISPGRGGVFGASPLQSVMPWALKGSSGDHQADEDAVTRERRAVSVNAPLPSPATTHAPLASRLTPTTGGSATPTQLPRRSHGSSNSGQPSQSSSWSLNNYIFNQLLEHQPEQDQDGYISSDEYSDENYISSDNADLNAHFAKQKLSKDEMEQQLINAWDMNSKQICAILNCFPRGASSEAEPTDSSSPASSEKAISPQYKIYLHLMFFSCSSCPKCDYWIHDEEIMNEWTPDISNLNTRCPLCHGLTVPKLTIRIILQTPCTSGPNQENLHNGNNSGDTSNEPSPTESTSWTFSLVDEHQCFYLSPFVLRKEMENVVSQEGEGALSEASFVTEHDILYWNMLWYSHRSGLPTHMIHFVLPWINDKSNQAMSNTNVQIRNLVTLWKDHLQPQLCGVYIHTRWDSPGIRSRSAKPLYEILRQWKADLVASKSASANSPFASSPRHPPLAVRVGEQIVRHIRDNNMDSAVKHLLHYRLSDHASTLQHGQTLPLYRNIYYLVTTQLGSQSINILAFFHYYREVYHRLPQRNHVQAIDKPLKTSALWCHLVFRDLEL